MASKRPIAGVTPALLRWARETAGLSQVEMARALGKSWDETRIERAEAGGEPLTIGQARKWAAKAKRPLVALFLDAPPDEPHATTDFRSRASRGNRKDEARFEREIQLAVERRDELIDALDAEDIAEVIGAGHRRLLAASLKTDPTTVSRAVLDLLKVDAEVRRGWRNADRAFQAWRLHVEALGILVITFPAVPIDVARGFSLPDPVLPVIGVNAADWPSAKIFTLLHELAHLTLRQSAACEPLGASVDAAEVWCNAVAAQALVPDAELAIAIAHLQASRVGAIAWTDAELGLLAARFRASKDVILRRLLGMGLVAREEYERRHLAWLDAARHRHEAARSALKDRPGGPTYLTVKQSQWGANLPRLVLFALAANALTRSTACEVLGVKTKTLDRLGGRVVGG